MYQIKCDEHIILDMRDEDYIVSDPKLSIEENTVGSASFTIYEEHPAYHDIMTMKSIIEIIDEFGTIFRGRVLDSKKNFYGGKNIDCEGAMGFFNDSVIRPFSFPEDFPGAESSTNVVEYFLDWLIDEHNSQVQNFQKFQLGNVTVSDPNNYISRSSTEYMSTWDVLKSRLFESSLGGHFCIRYESNGNYIDYLEEYTSVNSQKIELEENILDLVHDLDGCDIYTVIVPLGAEKQADPEDEEDTGGGRISIDVLPDGPITSDIIKSGDLIYSQSSVADYGWIVAPISDTTWDDVNDPAILRNKAADMLENNGLRMKDTIEISAVDLHYTNSQIQSFRINRKINVVSEPHGINQQYDLTKLDIDLLNPQNTKIVVGETRMTLIEQENHRTSQDNLKIEDLMIGIKKDVVDARKVATDYIDYDITEEGALAIGHKVDGVHDGIRAVLYEDSLVFKDKNGHVVAEFGVSTAQIGKDGTARFIIDTDKLRAYDSQNRKYFEVSETGLMYGDYSAASERNIVEAISSIDSAVNGMATYSDGTHTVYLDDDGYYYLNSNEERVNVSESSLTKDADGNPLVTYRGGIKQELDAGMSAIEDELSEVDDQIGQLESDMVDVEGKADNALVNRGYAIITNDPALILGRTDGNSAVRITDDAIEMIDGGNPIAYIIKVNYTVGGVQQTRSVLKANDTYMSNMHMKSVDGNGRLTWIAESDGSLTLKVVD